jgi:galactokinase
VTPHDRDAVAGFRHRTGHEPAVVWSCPGRVNLIGDHTDHQGGLALPFALDRHVTVAVGARDDTTVRVSSADYPGADAVGSLLHQPKSDSWASYVLGAAWLLHGRGLLARGADVCVSSTLPVGAGLSSSAAVTCATVCALADLAGAPLSRHHAARIAQQVETDVLGAPVGLLDQTAVLFAEADAALLVDFAADTHESVPLPGGGWGFAAVDTHVRHANADGQYAALRRRLDEARERLGVASLSELDPGSLAGREADLGAAYPAVRHVVTENDRVRRTVEALRRDDIAAVGALMLQSHASLRDDLAVSCPELDLAVALAMEAGATGARMTGGGFGGSVVVLAPGDVLDGLKIPVEQQFRREGMASPTVFEVRAVAGADRSPG